MRIDADELRQQAAQWAGQESFGDDPFAESLDHLLDSLASDGALTPAGVEMTKAEFSGHLRNRLLVQQWLQREPEIERRRIEKPVFFLGLPRSGTTLLLNLFDHDERLRLLRTWEAREPAPPPALDAASVTRRIASAREQLGQWNEDVPKFDTVHLVDAEGPDECTSLLSHGFAQAGFHNYLNVERWFDWMVDHLDFNAAYTLHRQQLQLLQHGASERRWALKYPNHVLAIDAIRRVYPDASFVFTHRDPDVTLASLCSLTHEFRAPRTDRNDPGLVGRQISAFVLKHVQRIMEFRNSPAAGQCTVVDVDYYRMVEHPIAIVDEIYRAIGMSMSPVVEQRLANWTRANPQHKRGAHDYTADKFGLDGHHTDAAFRAYRAAFGIRSERASA